MERGEDTALFAQSMLLCVVVRCASGVPEGGPSEAFIMEIVERVKKGEGLDCPICMECAEDAVLSPCAHSFCRECILTAWQGKAEGSCPTCRKEFQKKDLITVPRTNRFTLDVHKNWTESVKVRGARRQYCFAVSI